jgi:alkylation response protein AidB-like acyl-CoA dehydrogenase
VSAEVATLVADLMRKRPIGDGAGLWETVVDLGLDGIGVPEEAGGSGGSLADLATAVTEFAAHGVDLPLGPAAVTAWAAHTGADEEAAALRLAVLRAAAIAGAARGAYELTRSHVRTRQQFGKPLVALPAVAASLATIRVAVLQVEAAVTGALAVAESPVPGRAAAAAETARVVAAATATTVAERAHQLHGAIGTAQEYALHHLTRMLWSLRDADVPEQAWVAGLGTRAVNAGEDAVWDVFTAPAPATEVHLS